MSIRHLFSSVAALSILAGCNAATPSAPSEPSTPTSAMESAYQMFQPSSSPKVEAMLADMTLDEKLAQISCIWFDKAKVLEKDGSFNPEKMKENFPHGIGCWARPQDTFGMEDQGEERDANDASVTRRMSARTPSQTVVLNNAVQKWHVEETRLGIPTMFHEEGPIYRASRDL